MFLHGLIDHRHADPLSGPECGDLTFAEIIILYPELALSGGFNIRQKRTIGVGFGGLNQQGHGRSSWDLFEWQVQLL